MVSVVTTVLNAERFLGEAIQSVVSQTYTKWELIVVDDGSTDRSIQVARAWRSYDSRIQVLTHPDRQNHGISASRNLGIAASRGDLIAFLDADDVWASQKLDLQVESLNSLPQVAMTFGAAERWYSWSQASDHQTDFVVPSIIPGWGSDRVIPPPALLEAFLQDESRTPCTCSVLIRKRCIEQLGGFENAFTGIYDDQVFYAKLALSYPVYVSSHCVSRYRQHPDSTCAKARESGEQTRTRQVFLEWLENYRMACVPSR